MNVKISVIFLFIGFEFQNLRLNSQTIAGGAHHSLFICNNSSQVFSSGGNFYGQLGNGTTINDSFPVHINTLSNITDVSCGDGHSLFLRNDSSVWACGYNGYGQLGDGTNIDKHTPIQINSLNKIVSIAGGADHSVFLKSDSTVLICGWNGFGQLGLGNRRDTSSLTPVQGLNNIIKIAAGHHNSIFLKSDGSVWVAGCNSYGQLGNGTGIHDTIPTQFNGLSGIVDIAAGYEFFLFLKNDSTVWGCGRNNYGQLGDGTTTDKSSAVQVNGLTGIISIAAGYNFSLFLKNNGTVYSCGFNISGQLGDGTTVTTYSNPCVQAGSLSGVTEVDAGWYGSFFRESNGNMLACGSNLDGQLGDGTTADKHTPVVVAGACNSPLSLNERSIAGISVYPNPGIGEIYISRMQADATLSVYDLNGRIVKVLKIERSQEPRKVNLSVLENGVYYYNLSTSGGDCSSGKIIILK